MPGLSVWYNRGSTWHKYFIFLAFFWVLFIVSKWKWTRTTALFRVLGYCVPPILRPASENREQENQFMRLSIHVYYICLNLWDILPALIYAAHENWSAVGAFCNLSAACLLINIHPLRKTYRLDNSLPNVQYVYISIRRKEEKCSVKLALFCFFNAHNSPDVKGSSFK